jgi:hypothetical protein
VSAGQKHKRQRPAWRLHPAYFYIPPESVQMPGKMPLRQRYGEQAVLAQRIVDKIWRDAMSE